MLPHPPTELLMILVPLGVTSGGAAGRRLPPASSFRPRPRSPGPAECCIKTRSQSSWGLEKPHNSKDKPDR